MPNIYCSVQNCHYWKKGNVCDTNEIMVTSVNGLLHQTAMTRIIPISSDPGQ